MNRAAVIVLNWNGIDDTIACLSSLLAQTYKDTTIVVIDNGSTDRSLEVLESFTAAHADKVHLIKNDQNKGFAGGVNTGITWAIEQGFRYIALFNNDALAEVDWLNTLVNTLKDSSDVGIVTGLLLHEGGKTVDSTGEQYSEWGLPFPRNRGDNTIFAPKSEYVFGATGGATLYRTKLFENIGLFDERFFAYYEDVDMSFRAQLAGYKVAYNADAVAYHKQGATSKKIPGFTVYQTFKNLPLLFWKNVPARLLLTVGPRFLLAYALMYGNTFTHGTAWAATRGFWKSLVYLPGELRERRAIQGNRHVTDAYIKSILWPDLPPNQIGLRKLRRFITRK